MIEGSFRVAVFRPDTGEILRIIDTTDVFAMAEQHGVGEDWVPVDEEVRDDMHLVMGGRAVLRPTT